MRSAIRDLMKDPISADQSLKKRARDWRETVESARSREASELIGSAEWETARTFLGSITGSKDDLLEAERQLVVAGLTMFAADSTSTEALDLIERVKINCGKKGNWVVEISEVKLAIKAVREQVNDALDAGIIRRQESVQRRCCECFAKSATCAAPTEP